MSWLAVGIGAGAGLLKSQVVDRPKEKRQRHLAAETQRYSPWTGMQAGPIQEADPFGSMLQGGMTGATIQQGLGQQKLQNGLITAQTDALNNWSQAGGGLRSELPPNMAASAAAGPMAGGPAAQAAPNLYGQGGSPWSVWRY